MNLTSDSKLGCPDYCQYDAGHNCFLCDRFKDTKYFKVLKYLTEHGAEIKEEDCSDCGKFGRLVMSYAGMSSKCLECWAIRLEI